MLKQLDEKIEECEDYIKREINDVDEFSKYWEEHKKEILDSVEKSNKLVAKMKAELTKAKASAHDSVDKSIDDEPDADTPSGRKQINMSIALTAVRKALPDQMWNWNGNKITIDNNRIVLVVTDDAVIWKNFKGSKDMRFTNEIALANELREALNL